MENTKITKYKDELGNDHVNRVPDKILNPFIKQTIMSALKRPDTKVEAKHDWGSSTFKATCVNGTVIIYENGWDYGFYVLSVNGKVVGQMEWFENDNNTNQQQRDIFDIAHLMSEKSDEQARLEDARKSLTVEEQLIVEALNRFNARGK